jgi:hypothetical protein
MVLLQPSPTLFTLVILEIGSHFVPRIASTAVFLFYASHCHWDDRQETLYTAIGWDGVSQAFCLWADLEP